MEVKTPVPLQTQPQTQQPPGQTVVFKAAESGGHGFSFSSHYTKPLFAGLIMLFLVGGVGVGVYLVGQQQQVKSRASDDIPQNLSAVVPKSAVNNVAIPSAEASPKSASSSADLAEITIPELEDVADNASESAESVAEYDFSDDGMVNSVDLSVMYSGWGTPKNDNQIKADLNADGIINGIDYSIFLPYFSQKSEN